MLRNITSFLSAAVRNNLSFLENGRLFSLEKFSQNRFFSEVALNEEPRKDRLFKKIEIEVRGNDPEVLKSYGTFSCTAAGHLGIPVGRNFAPLKAHGKYKAVHERFTVLKSKHIHKKHRVQYEIRTYYRYMDFLKLTESTTDTFLEYIQRNLPEGVAMKVTKVEIKALPESVHAAPIQT